MDVGFYFHARVGEHCFSLLHLLCSYIHTHTCSSVRWETRSRARAPGSLRLLLFLFSQCCAGSIGLYCQLVRSGEAIKGSEKKKTPDWDKLKSAGLTWVSGGLLSSLGVLPTGKIPFSSQWPKETPESGLQLHISEKMQRNFIKASVKALLIALNSQE